ncbi:hypothetical protein VCRA2123O443_220028 [Vibrio crassostreae]|nr:hypothetical protein VCRA2110O182_220027 [Vibrio crassostreae]CAK2309512.1 hypothetical protein VCRA2111O408_220029 [Vibrio crassostreae]CAK2326242.1 hypothetical protein VCRA211O406_220027 [Vibrio crassostreae]CAK3239657.1 hypothetical protein VCRA2123O443_220028 [Vibrio crassostreae]
MKTLDDEYEKNIGQFHGSESDLDDIDSAKGFADLSRRWASEDYGTSVDGVEYSSKHYATDSKESSEVSLEAAEISVNASNVATDGATNAKQSEDNAKVSEDNAKQSEDNIYALVDGIDDVVNAAIESVVNEGNTQVTRVTDEGDTQVNRVAIEGRDQAQAVNDAGEQQIDLVVGEGDSQVSRLDSHAGGLSNTLTNEANVHIENIGNIGEVVEQDLIRTGDIQVLRVRNEGDIQVGRAGVEADRAEAAAIDLDNAPRYHGYFSPNIGYPPPPEQRIPYQWFCTEDGSAGGIAWSEGDMLYYAPHPTDPDDEMGQYFRVAGELAAGGDPQPIEIPDDLIMQVNKRIYFRDSVGRLVQAISLDGNDDLLVGDMTPDEIKGGFKAVNAIGLGGSEVYHVVEQSSDGAPIVFFKMLSEQNGALLEGNSTQTFQVAEPVEDNHAASKKFVEDLVGSMSGKLQIGDIVSSYVTDKPYPDESVSYLPQSFVGDVSEYPLLMEVTDGELIENGVFTVPRYSDLRPFYLIGDYDGINLPPMEYLFGFPQEWKDVGIASWYTIGSTTTVPHADGRAINSYDNNSGSYNQYVISNNESISWESGLDEYQPNIIATNGRVVISKEPGRDALNVNSIQGDSYRITLESSHGERDARAFSIEESTKNIIVYLHFTDYAPDTFAVQMYTFSPDGQLLDEELYVHNLNVPDTFGTALMACNNIGNRFVATIWSNSEQQSYWIEVVNGEVEYFTKQGQDVHVSGSEHLHSLSIDGEFLVVTSPSEPTNVLGVRSSFLAELIGYVPRGMSRGSAISYDAKKISVLDTVRRDIVFYELNSSGTGYSEVGSLPFPEGVGDDLHFTFTRQGGLMLTYSFDGGLTYSAYYADPFE